MQIQSLKDQCADYITTDLLTSENCLKWWKLGKQYSSNLITERARPCVLENFFECKDEVLTLDAEDLCSLIKDDDLITSSEEAVCNIVLDWFNADPKRRSQHCENVVKELRLFSVLPEYLKNILEENKFILRNKASKEYISRVQQCQTCPSALPAVDSPSFCHRNLSEIVDVVVVIGGSKDHELHFDDTPTCTRDVFAARLPMDRFRSWYKLSSLPHNPGEGFAVCSYFNNIYLSGGNEMLHNAGKKIVKYLAESNTWIQCSNMLDPREFHCMVALCNSIYILGGRIPDTDGRGDVYHNIEQYRNDGGECVEAGTLIHGVYGADAAVSGECIYVFGGLTYKNRSSRQVQCFNTRTKCSYFLCGYPPERNYLRSICVNQRILTLNEDGDVRELLDYHDTATAHIGDVCNLISFLEKIEGPGIIQDRGRILIVGGRVISIDPNQLSDRVFSFQIEENQPADVELVRIPFGRCNHGCVKIALKKSFLKTLA